MLSHEVSVWRLSEGLVRLGHYWPVPIDILGFAHIPRELFEHHLPESSRAVNPKKPVMEVAIAPLHTVKRSLENLGQEKSNV